MPKFKLPRETSTFEMLEILEKARPDLVARYGDANNGLGRNQASIGFGFGMMERHGGLPKQTASDWITEESAIEGVRNNGAKWLKTPSGQLYRVSEITDSENNYYWNFSLSDDEWALLIPDKKRVEGHLSLQLVIQDWCDCCDWRWSLKSLDTPGYRAEISLSKDHCLSHEAKYPEQAFLGAYLKVIFAEVPQSKSA